MEKSHQELVADAKTRIHEASIDEVRGLIKGGATVVDLRDPADWANGHLPGATHIPRAELESRIAQELPDPAAEVVLYCGGGGKAALAADRLQALGYTNVHSLAGGFRGWNAQGGPTTRE